MNNNGKNPIFLGADPFMLSYGGKYYIYCTTQLADAITYDNSAGYDVYESVDLINWTNRGQCLNPKDVKGDKWFWAPEVIYYKNKFYMVYTAEEHMGVAVADSPLGPFTQENKVWLREDKSIDGHFFMDDDGQVYLYYVRLKAGNRIYVAKMNEDLLSIAEECETCLIEAQEPWETIDCKVAEGPFVLKHKNLYYLTYSCNHTRCKDYAVGYAVSNSPYGPFKRYEGNPVLCRNGDFCGVGHHSFAYSKDKNQLFCAYHCHNPNGESYKPRNFCLNKAAFIENENGDDILKIDGPKAEIF